MRKLHHITLELSGKPFMDDSDAELYRVVRKLFTQWARLISTADAVQVMLMPDDGSEILEFTGDLDQCFEWSYWQGIANPLPPSNAPGAMIANPMAYRPCKYRADAAPRPYRWLKRLNEVLREVCVELVGKSLRIGIPFDNGPEFSVSDFKYHRHREIARAHSIYPNSFVTCDAVLHADDRAYAAFPNGIPEGTTLGKFLGAQFYQFAKALGFDYLWLSNGMGFGLETWGMTGALFDGRNFYPERKSEAAGNLKRFWTDLVSELHGIKLETRGSNYSAGQEIASDGAPLKWLYDNHLIAPPVNSPSSAIYGNTGLSIAAYMSHIAEIPAGGFPYRYYIHDPWFLNSPWLDRFGRQPWDLYPVTSVSRVDADGKIENFSSIALLTCDDSWGRMPDQVPDEVTPHLLETLRTAPDAPGAFLLVYPFDEYSATDDLRAVVNEEMFAADMLQGGLPLNTVISTGNFRRLAAEKPDWFNSTTLVVPLFALRSRENFDAVSRLVASGHGAIVYGALTDADIRAAKWLGVKRSNELCGEFTVPVNPRRFDSVAAGGFARVVNVAAVLDGGGLSEISAGAEVLAEAVQNQVSRVLATVTKHGGGKAVFVRSLPPLLNLTTIDGNATLHPRTPFRGDAATVFPTERLMRVAAAEFGWTLRVRFRTPGQLPPRLTLSRHANAFYLNGYTHDMSVDTEIVTPLGIPVPEGHDVIVENGVGVFRLEKAPHYCIQALVRQTSGVLSGAIHFTGTPDAKGRFDLRGLCNADVRFFVPEDHGEVQVKLKSSGATAYFANSYYPFEWEDNAFGRCVLVRNVSGTLHVKW